MNKNCDVCGASFIAKPSNKKRCSEDCQKKAYSRNTQSWWDARPEMKAEKSKRAYARYKASTTPEERRESVLLKRYGISREEFDALLEKQGGHCAICPSTEGLVVDHDHSCCPSNRAGKTCGKCIRGILCQDCNKALGNVNDDVERLKSAIRYLEEV